MKKNLNVIQIKGVKGLIIACFAVCCLAAGFIAFPGWLCQSVWNFVANYYTEIPTICLFLGILLWGILLTSYFLFRKEKVVVCMKTPQGLSEEELKAVFADMKRQTIEDPILQAMMKAREAELKYKAQQDLDNKESEAAIDADSTKI